MDHWIFLVWFRECNCARFGGMYFEGKKKDISLNIFKWMELINDKWQFVYYQLIIGDIAQFHSLREGLRLPS